MVKLMKYCPNCGKAGVAGMKFCPQCGQKLIDIHLEEKQRSTAKPKAHLEDMKVGTEAAPLGTREAEIKRDIRSWGIALIVIGVIHLVLSEFLDPIWGGILIVIGVSCLFIMQRGMYIVIGIGIILAGIMNMFLTELGGWTIFGAFQIGFGIYQFHKFRKYGSTAVDYDKHIELNPDNADAYHERGHFYYEIDEYGKAIADYSKAIELDPSHASAYFERAYAYGEIGEYDKAIADYSKAIALDPDDAQAYYNRGLDYHNKGEVDKTVCDLNRCIELSTDTELTKDAQQALLETKNSL